MNIQVVNITAQDRDLMSGLDPFERLSLLELPGAFALAALATDENGEPIPAGLMTGFADRERLSISWLGVIPAMQGCGIGETLLLKAYDLACDMDIAILEALISSDYEASGAIFFSDRLFEQEEPLAMEYAGSLYVMNKLDYFRKDLHRLPMSVSLSSLPPAQIKNVLSRIDAIDEAAKLYSVANARGLLDMDASFVLIDENEVCGVLLVQKLEEELLPVCFYSEGKNDSASLILHSLAAASEKYGENTDVLIFPRSGNLGPLLKTIFPQNKTEGKKLIAKTEDYRNLKESI